MRCHKCDRAVPTGEVYEFKDKKLCDDCYIDLLIGVPDLDVSKLPEEVQARFHRVLKAWHRDRPNRHHHLKFPRSR